MMSAKDVLRKHFELMTDVKDVVPDDNVAHFWLINKNWPAIGSTIVLSQEEHEALKEIFD